MQDSSFRTAELLLQGFKCSHVLMILALEAQGRSNPDLVRAMSGLALGMGQGFNCGALTGGCCVLGLYGGRSEREDADAPHFDAMLDDFSGWFNAYASDKFGGIDCADIMAFDERLKMQRCPALIADVWEKLSQTLADHGLDIAQAPEADGSAESGR
ncbi:DVU_1555 family C-GCAxxG-C-C protein [Consotaella salsifontis]|uniref:Putative redox-active protein (C_GCAxxG_C_C) n=1 Tax=Consotaella salsifontis TaxID=1365950 RepID=A0A1T4MIA4_9HYPH|nr:DV_1555 family C-GCAxxG-C-C protein [Consotaella salsifontis]SJZ66576.1 Putative redox-active protein (C_GCAxxG_C_C) [Consotaella salsifontis]